MWWQKTKANCWEFSSNELPRTCPPCGVLIVTGSCFRFHPMITLCSKWCVIFNVTNLRCLIMTKSVLDLLPKRNTPLPECGPIVNWGNTSACSSDIALDVHNLCVPPRSLNCRNLFIWWDDPVQKTKNIYCQTNKYTVKPFFVLECSAWYDLQKYPETIPQRCPTNDTFGIIRLIIIKRTHGYAAVGTLKSPRTFCVGSIEALTSTTKIEKITPDSPAL